MHLKELSQVIAGAQEVIVEYFGGKEPIGIKTTVLDELLEEDAFPLLDGEIVSVYSDEKSRIRIRLSSNFPQEYLKSDLSFFLDIFGAKKK